MLSPSKADSEQFRKLFSEVAVARDFVWAHGGWFGESPECVIVLDQQKSNLGNYFELNIKVFVQGLFSVCYSRSKEMVKRLTGDVLLRPPDHDRWGMETFS